MESSGDRCQTLSRCGQGVDNVKWSADHRLAVTTPEIIFVCTLLSSSSHSTPSHKPLMLISTAHALKASRPHTLTALSPTTPTTITEQFDQSLVQTSYSHDQFKQCDWSPLGCSYYKGCVLTSLTASGRLLLFTAPHSQGKVWRHILTLTNTLLDAEIVSTLTQQNKALFSVCTAFSWLPSLLNDDGYGLLAMATRSGHLVLVEVPLPIGESSGGGKVVWVDAIANCEAGMVWGCALNWCFDEHLLVVGCTDGRVLGVSWEDISFQRSEVKTLWETDGLPVYHMTCLPRPPTVVMAKGSMLVVCTLSEGSPPIKAPTTGYGVHSLPLSGLVRLGERTLLSSALDGTLQLWRVDSDRPHPLNTGASKKGSLAVRGLAVSHNGLVAAFTLSERLSQDRKQCCYLTFLNLTTQVDSSPPAVHSLWDIVHCLRQLESGHSPPPMLQLLLETAHKTDTRRSAMLSLQTSIVSNQSHDLLLAARRGVLRAQAEYWLEELTFDPKDMASRQSIGLMLSWLAANSTPAPLQQREELAQTETAQLCPVCESPVELFTDLLSYQCPNKHSWDICPLSFQLVGVWSECCVCVQCGGAVNTISSLQPERGSWLHKLLSWQIQCPYCGGYFEGAC